MKKLTLSVLALILTAGVSFGQLREVDNGGIPNEDQIPDSRLEQHEAFLNGDYRLPAKPRNMWTFGIEGGYDQITGDVNPDFGWNAGLNFRKALGYATSIRFGSLYVKPEGNDFDDSPSNLIHGSTKANRSDINTAGQNWLYDHQFEQEGFIPYAEFVLNLNNINFHREQNKWNFELSAGPAAYLFDTKTTFANVRNNVNGTVGTFEDIALGNSDDTREDAEIGDFNVIPAATFSAGVSYRAGDRVAITLRPRYTRTWEDWLDGEAYDDTGMTAGSNSDYSPDKDGNIAANLALDFSLGNSDNRTQPLWWENPLNFTYPYLQDAYEFDEDYLFEDSDGDGVVDRMDKEPNSPCSFVDGGGVAIDSDKDGIPDCNDACPFTPAAVVGDIDENGCTPVIDKNCCDDIDELKREIESLKARPVVPTNTCANASYPSVTFSSNSKAVPSSQNAMISSIASTMNANPTCRIVVEGFSTGRRKVAQQVAWARAKAVADALVDNYGISRDRIIVRYSGVEGFGDVVNVRSARDGEYGSSNPAAPFPGN